MAYAQQQNDCFRTEYSALAGDCDSHIEWATEAFGALPEAVNLWIGNHRSQTSFHKDHYENLYAVVTGEKHFLLLPPTDVHRLYIREYPAATYRYSWVCMVFRCFDSFFLCLESRLSRVKKDGISYSKKDLDVNGLTIYLVYYKTIWHGLIHVAKQLVG